MAATEDKLGALHVKVADVLIEALDGEELPGYEEEGPDGEVVVVPPKRMLPSAAIIAAATKFLKDNEITCTPSENNSLGRLKELAEERRNKRALTPTDLADATRAGGFLYGAGNA